MFSKIFRFPAEFVWFGPLYALIKLRIKDKKQLDPEKNWDFWIRSRKPILQAVFNSYPAHFMRTIILHHSLNRNHEAGIADHYELPNRFFGLFLDKKYRFYSCADFLSPSDTLETAQKNKVDSLLKLIQPKFGERILDLGCGWGGMMKAIADYTGDRKNLSGYTLSKKQEHFVREQIGLPVFYKNFITADYEKDHWDKIYSIGAWEHVKLGEIIPLLQNLHQALSPDGLLVKHFFCLNRKGLSVYMIAGQIFFPGSLLVSWD